MSGGSRNLYHLFFKKISGHWYPFWTFGDVCSGFQSQSSQPYSHFMVCSLRFTSGATPAGLLTASMAASRCSPHVCFSRGRVPDSNEGNLICLFFGLVQYQGLRQLLSRFEWIRQETLIVFPPLCLRYRTLNLQKPLRYDLTFKVNFQLRDNGLEKQTWNKMKPVYVITFWRLFVYVISFWRLFCPFCFKFHP